MDFSNRNVQPSAPAPAAAPATASSRRNHSQSSGKWNRVGVVAAIIAVVVLLIGAILVVSSSNSNTESKYVDSSKLQAVFLNTGQVYFGNVKTLNSKYVVLTNIYYLQTANSGGSSSATSANSNVSLVKLGCELHQPYDQMVINRTQVTFWENLQDGGQVANAVKSFQTKNPSGQKCGAASNASTTSGAATQNAGSSTPSSSTTTKP